MSSNDKLVKIQIFRYINENKTFKNSPIISYIELANMFGGHYSPDQIKQHCHDIATETGLVKTEGDTVELLLKGSIIWDDSNVSDYDTLVALSKNELEVTETVESIYEEKKSKYWTIRTEIGWGVGIVAGILTILKIVGVF